jgi:hypothetical protein
MSDQLVSLAANYTTHKLSVTSGSVESAVPATEGPQTEALDRTATGIGVLFYYIIVQRKGGF